MYKVFCNDSELVFASENENWESELYYDKYKVLHNEIPDLQFIEKKLARKKKKSYVFLFSKGLIANWKNFIRPYLHLKAGGGIVKNKSGELLVIFRKGKWDLPKGKLEAAETEEEGALREVEEETGVKVEIVFHQPIYTYHMYRQKGKVYIKRSAWFHMTSTNDKKMKPQKNEGISDVRWMTRNAIQEEFLANTYPTISAVLSTHF